MQGRIKLMTQVKAVSQSSEIPVSSQAQSEPDVFQFLAQLAEEYPHIAAIYAINVNEVIDLWTVISPNSDTAEESLAEIDVELLQQFPHIAFDFMTVYKGEEQFIGTQLQGSTLIYSKMNCKGK